jgi:cellobiose-specific phosphotransferase system component IIC
MNPLNSIGRGLIAAMPVCLVVAAIIFVRANAIESAESAAVGLGGDTAIGWVGTWTIITLAFGVVATATYDHLSLRREWNGMQYLSFALSLAIVLSAVAFLRMYEGEMHPFRIEYSALNFAYAFGFGCMVPALTAVPRAQRAIVGRTGQTTQ